MVRPNTSCLLSVLVALATTLPTPGYREEANLLTSISLGHLTSKFEAPEEEIEHMADLDNTELTSLGNLSFPLLSSHIFSSPLLSFTFLNSSSARRHHNRGEAAGSSCSPASPAWARTSSS